jgi:hypothetical protein
MKSEGLSGRHGISFVAPALIVVLVVALAAVGIYAYSVRSTTVTTTVTATVTATVTQYITETQTVAPSGSQTFLNGQSVGIPSGQSYLYFTFTIQYDGYLTVSYTSTNNIHWSYSYGSTKISTPSSSSETGLTLPVLAGSLTLYMDNDNCGLFGCGSNTAVVTLTYTYP